MVIPIVPNRNEVGNKEDWKRLVKASIRCYDAPCKDLCMTIHTLCCCVYMHENIDGLMDKYFMASFELLCFLDF
jgi:hypothetical protein